MQPIDEIYRARLRMLVNEIGTVNGLATQIGKSATQVSQWMNGSIDSRSGKPRALSRQSARQIEEALGKPEGWMDQPIEVHARLAPPRDRRQPLISGTVTDVAGMADLISPPSQSQHQVQEARNGYADQSADYVEVPYVRFKLSAGAHGFAVEYLNGTREPLWFRRAWFKSRGLNPRKVFACDIKGPSMQPGLEEGDTVLVNTDSTEARDGKVFAVVYEGEMVVKRLRRNAGEWWLASDNPDQVRHAPKLCDANCRIVGEVVHKQSETI